MSTFPDLPGDERQAWLHEQVLAGEFTYAWEDLTLRRGPDELLVRVMADALRVRGVRVPVSAYELQMLADMLDCVFLTTKLLDERHWAAKWKIPAYTMNPKGHPPTAMMSKAWTLRYSTHIDDKLREQGYDGKGIVSDVGKIWTLRNDITPAKACNYGMYAQEAPYLAETFLPKLNIRLWQQPGYKHDFRHADYSQTGLLADVRVWLNGVARDLRELYADPKYASMVSHTGPLTVVRQPGVPVFGVAYGRC